MGIRQLARELGLSIGTVSRALNDQPDVKEETRARVKEAAARLGYVPNQSGRSLRKGRTGIVAALIPTEGFDHNSDGGLFRVLEGMRRTLVRDELDLIVMFRGPDEDPLTHLQRVVSRRIADAVIIMQTAANDPRFEYLENAGVDYAALGRSAGREAGACIDFKFEDAAAEAARRFATDDHQRLALILSDSGMNYEDILEESFRAESKRCGLREDAVHIVRAANSELPSRIETLIADAHRRPTGMLAAHESVAAMLYRALASAGLEVGRDVAVMSTSPLVDNRALSPALSHFNADLDAAGAALATRLIRSLSGRKPVSPSTEPTLIPMEFTAHQSHLRGPVAAAG